MEDKRRNAFSSIVSLNHEYYCLIWKLVKSGELEDLEGRGRLLGQLMLEHPQYQYFWEIPYSFGKIELERALEEERANPDAHLQIELIILEQIENRDPPEIYEAYEALLKIGKEAHEARHVISRVLGEVLYQRLHMARKGQQPPDEDFYLRRIRYLAKHPKKAVKNQERKYGKGEGMGLPSDEEWQAALRKSEEAFRKALAMPNKTIVEVLIQGAELVNAIGVKAIFLMSNITKPEKGVMYEDELEARAAIETFREACNRVSKSFDEVLQFLDEQRGSL
jgi:hypothetical protein